MITGRRPIRSESRPSSGAQMNCIAEYAARIRPIAPAPTPRRSAYIGRKGITMPKPSRSKKTVMNRTRRAARPGVAADAAGGEACGISIGSARQGVRMRKPHAGAAVKRATPMRASDRAHLRGGRSLLRVRARGKAVNDLAGTRIAELFADEPLEVAVIALQPAQLDLQRGVGFEQPCVNDLQPAALGAQGEQIAQAQWGEDDVQGE